MNRSMMNSELSRTGVLCPSTGRGGGAATASCSQSGLSYCSVHSQRGSEVTADEESVCARERER